ncbi:hypothetical protein J6590_088602 [Homalodisca vitripennis]|nr:hypothetical protein J6590_088602 [Homalodisca vitripennis]
MQHVSGLHTASTGIRVAADSEWIPCLINLNCKANITVEHGQDGSTKHTNHPQPPTPTNHVICERKIAVQQHSKSFHSVTSRLSPSSITFYSEFSLTVAAR